MTNINALLIIVLFHIASGEPVLALENVKSFRKGMWDVSLDSQYYRTDSNLSEFSSRDSLPGSNYYQLIDLTLGTRYVSTEDFALYGTGNLGIAESSGAGEVRSNGSLNQFSLGAEYKVYDGYLNVITELQLIYPIDHYTGDTNDVMNGEGVNQTLMKVYLQKRSGNTIGFSYLGFDYRNGGRSHLMPWGIGGEHYVPGWAYGGEVYGFQSITHDQDVDNTLSRRVTAVRIAGGSQKFYSVDPSMLAASLYFKTDIAQNWRLKMGFGIELAGNNYAGGYYAFAGITIRNNFGSWLEKKTGRRNSSYIYTPLSTEKDIEKFEHEINDPTLQKHFRPEPSQKDSYKAPGPYKEQEDPKFNAPVDPNKSNEPDVEAVQIPDTSEVTNKLEDVDFQIKLKKKPKPHSN